MNFKSAPSYSLQYPYLWKYSFKKTKYIEISWKIFTAGSELTAMNKPFDGRLIKI